MEYKIPLLIYLSIYICMEDLEMATFNLFYSTRHLRLSPPKYRTLELPRQSSEEDRYKPNPIPTLFFAKVSCFKVKIHLLSVVGEELG